MKKNIAFLLLILTLSTMLLTACTDETAIKQVYQKVAVINYTDRTITYDGVTYHYEYSHNKLKLVYPNETICTLYNRDSFISMDWQYSENQGEDVKAVYELGYLHPNVIMYQILEAPPTSKPEKAEAIESSFGGVFVIFIGAFIVFFPKTVWLMKDGWRKKEAQPSNTAIIMHRVSGIVAILAGLIWLVK